MWGQHAGSPPTLISPNCPLLKPKLSIALCPLPLLPRGNTTTTTTSGAISSLTTPTKQWPQVLPELAWPPKALKEDYGLQAIMPGYPSIEEVPLARELEAFKAWCIEPMQLSRGLAYSNPVKEVTFEGVVDTIHGMLGCCFKVSNCFEAPVVKVVAWIMNYGL